MKIKKIGKIGLLNFGGGDFTLGLSIIADKLKEAGYQVENINPREQRHFDDYDVLGFSIFWWEHKYNYIRFLKEAGIDPKKKKPFLVLGGMDMFNPLPLDGFFHYAVIGDGEDVIVPLMKAIESDSDPTSIDGIYVSGQKKIIHAQSTKKLSAKHYIDLRKAKQTRIEIARGCKNKCKFCLLSWVKPYREIRGDVLKYLIRTAKTKNVALFCADRGSHSDYERLELWCKKYNKANTGTDLRIDSAAKQKIISNLRFGIEAFSERIRQGIGKFYSNDKLVEYFRHIFENVKTPNGKNLTKMTIYMIFGLPGEDKEDMAEFMDLLQSIDEIAKYKFTMFLSFSTFMPYFHTPFQWAPIDPFKEWDKWFDSTRRHFKNIILAKHGGFVSPAKQIMQMLTIRGDERSPRIMYHLATTSGVKSWLNDRKAGHKKIEIVLRKGGYALNELIGEWPAGKTFPFDFIETHYKKDVLRNMWEDYRKKYLYL